MQRFPLFLILPALFFFSGCQKNEKTIKIGLAGVQTGADGQIGATMIYGSNIAITEWNERGGLLGQKIEGIARDDEGKPNQAVSVAQELSAQGVAAVIGHFNSGCTIPSSAIYSQNHILQITPGSTNPQVTERGLTTLFRIVGRDDQQGTVAGTFAREKLKAQKIAILHNKTAYGQGLADEVKKTFSSLGGAVVVFDGVSESELDFRANISALKNSGAEAVFWGGMYGQAGPLLVQLRQAGLSLPFLSGDGTIVQEFINTAGKYATDVYLTFGPDFKSLPAAQNFLAKYRAKYGEEGPYSVYGYDAANVLFEAIQSVGSLEPDKIAAALRSKTFHTCLGPVEFDAKGDLKKTNYILWTVQNNAFVALP